MVGRTLPLTLLLLLLVSSVSRVSSSEPTTNEAEGGHNNTNSSGHGNEIHIASINFDYIQTPLVVVIWVMLAVGVKVLYHSFERFTKFCPESCILIIVGVLAGLVFKYTGVKIIQFDAQTFFLFLLPPIVFDAGWCMPARNFFDNIGLILSLAVAGTLINSFGVGLGLFYLKEAGAIQIMGNASTIAMPGCLLFGSLIAAVDPVAVLAVFDTVHVNEVLHIVVEGESLLNDAVSVVLYKIMDIVAMAESRGETLDPKQYGIGFVAFLVISGGGTLIGLIYAIITSLFTRTLVHVRVVEPLVVFFLAYLSYLTAELFHWSGILAIIFCGFGMRHYVEENISRKSHTTIKYFMKMLAVASESVIFMFLGLALVTLNYDIQWGFIGFTIILCQLFRVISICLMVFISNQFRVAKIAKVDQFIMVYGGLRGAISFSLAYILDDALPYKDLLVTTTFAVIIFTVFIQGITIGPLVKLLHVRTHEKRKPTLNEEISEHVIAHVMWGVEEIVGKHGENYYRQWFDHIDNTYLLHWFTNKGDSEDQDRGDAKDILHVFHQLELKDAVDMANKHEVFDTKHRKPTNDNVRVAVKAPELPDLGEEAPLSDPNMRYTKLPSTTLEMEKDNFNQSKDKMFAAMKLNSRPAPKKRHIRLKHMFDADDDNDNAQRSMMGNIGYGGNIVESHHNAPMHHAMHPIIERKHHHKHGHHHHGSHKHHHKDKEHRRTSKNQQPSNMTEKSPNGVDKKAKAGSASWVRDLQYGSDEEYDKDKKTPTPVTPVVSKPPSPEHGAEKSKEADGVMETSLALPDLSEPPKLNNTDLGLGHKDEVGSYDFSDDVLEVDPRAHIEEYNPYMD